MPALFEAQIRALGEDRSFDAKNNPFFGRALSSPVNISANGKNLDPGSNLNGTVHMPAIFLPNGEY